MTQERIDLTQFEGHTEWLPARTYNEQLLVQMKYAEALAEIARQREEDPHEMNHADDALVVNATDLIAELKRCYELIDSLPTREAMTEMHDYTKWLETVESYFLADGSFNQDTVFVHMCAVNKKYGYRIEVIDGVVTVEHESE
jgi:hypothetical protein